MGPFRSLIAGLVYFLLPAAADATAVAGVVPAALTAPLGAVISEITTANDPAQKYALYLPRSYRPASPSPLLIVLDPRGRAEAALASFVPAAEPVLQPYWGGLIGCSGGRPPELPPLRSAPPDFFGCAGMRDYNYQQMRQLDRRLVEFGGNHRLDLFDGGHGWPPDLQLSGAIDWMELMAMRHGRAPRREDWIQAHWRRAQAEADAEADP